LAQLSRTGGSRRGQLPEVKRNQPQIPIDMRLPLSLVGAFGLVGEGAA